MRPIWVAEELGLPYELMPIGPRTGETRTPEYTTMNPKQKIPFCEDGDFRLSESLAICRYLTGKYGNAELSYPDDLQARAMEDEWLCFIYGELDETSLYVIRRHGALSEIYGEAPVAVAAAEQYVYRQLAVVDGHLQDRQYLVGEHFSLPDVFMMTCLDWVVAYGLDMTETLRQYRDEIAKRPAYQRAKSINSGGKA